MGTSAPIRVPPEDEDAAMTSYVLPFDHREPA
jgi:hypothetical protein